MMGISTSWLRNLFNNKEEVCCLGCGDCCREFSWHLKASEWDIDRWRKLGRDDILARVNRLGWLWYDPQTNARLPVCPYLVVTSPDKAHCSIHEIKPDICRAYPSQAQYRTCLKGTFLG